MGMPNEIYIVNAYRWGDNERHSYTVGVYTKKHKAREAANSHRDYRGGKYSCTVESTFINRFENDDNHYTKEIYRAISQGDLT